MIDRNAAPSAPRPRCLLVTASNSGYMHLLRGCVESFFSFPQSAGVDAV